jgi:hypothetical protein
VVDPDSSRIPRVPPYSGYCQSPSCLSYAIITLCDLPFQKVRLHSGFLLLFMQSYNPTKLWFGLFPLRSPLLRESLLISFPELLRWFTSLSIAHATYFIQLSMYTLACVGYPIRSFADQKICAPPRNFSQLITTFFAQQLLGIHHRPVFA